MFPINQKSINKLTALGMMTALVFVSNYLRITMPIAIGGGISAVAQGRVAAGSINILARQPEHWSKGMVLCIVVEFYAILSLLASIMMLLNIG